MLLEYYAVMHHKIYSSEGTTYIIGMTGAADKIQKCGITLPGKLVKSVDKIRGDIPRSTMIRRAVEQYMQERR